jgi:hypothetical protein
MASDAKEESAPSSRLDSPIPRALCAAADALNAWQASSDARPAADVAQRMTNEARELIGQAIEALRPEAPQTAQASRFERWAFLHDYDLARATPETRPGKYASERTKGAWAAWRELGPRSPLSEAQYCEALRPLAAEFVASANTTRRIVRAIERAQGIHPVELEDSGAPNEESAA